MLRYHSREQSTFTMNDHFPPISRTLRYKKVTKPLLERKRRARINRCLDELKNLVGALETDGENINKLEKADILELTVRYLKRISRLQDPVQEAHRFQAGFTQCASEACSFLLSLPGLDTVVGNRLVDHLKQSISKHGLDYRISSSDRRLKIPNTKSIQVSVPQNSHFSPIKSPASINLSTKSHRTLIRPKVTSPNNVLQSSPKITSSNILQLCRTSSNCHLAPMNTDTEQNGRENSMWRPW